MELSDSGRISGTSRPVEDSFFELLIDTLDGIDRPVRGLFLQRLLKSLTQLDLNEAQSLESWDRILERRRELTQLVGRPVALKTAMVDYLAASNLLHAPIVMEYEDLKKLQVNAATDPLTGLYNRRLFEEYFEKELNRARRYDLSLALIVMDLHVFKMVNDRFGHPRGDQVLQLAASTLRHSMRTSDFAFRIGGDEFALLLPQSDAEHAATLGRRVNTNFAGVLQPQQMDIPLGLDYGFAVYPQDGDQAEVLLRVADERLYEMKYSARAKNGTDVTSAADAARRQGPHTAPQPAADTSAVKSGDGASMLRVRLQFPQQPRLLPRAIFAPQGLLFQKAANAREQSAAGGSASHFPANELLLQSAMVRTNRIAFWT